MFRFEHLAVVIMLITTLLVYLPVGLAAVETPPQASPTPALELNHAVTLALQNNPGVAGMLAMAEALAAVPEQVSALPDPRFDINMMNLPVQGFDPTQEPMTQFQVGLTQNLPYPGKLALKGRAAFHESEAGNANVEVLRLNLAQNVRTIWWNLLYLDKALSVVDRNTELMHQFVQVAQTKYKVGQGLQQDVLLAQLELSKLKDKQIGLIAMRHNQVAVLNTLLNRPIDREIRLPTNIKDELGELPDTLELYQMAIEFHPALTVKQKKIDAARAHLELARKDFLPDFMLGATYGIRGGENPDGSGRADFLSLMFSINVPILNTSKRARLVDQRLSQRNQSQYELQDTKIKIQQEVSQGITDYHQARDQAILFKTGIILQATQTVSSMLAAYQVNKVDFLNLIRAQITLFDYETRYWKTFSEAKQALARLIAATGNRLKTN